MAYKKILIAIDGSELAEKALTQGANLAKALDAEIVVVTVTEPYHHVSMGEAIVAFPAAEYENAAAKAAADMLNKAEQHVRGLDAKCETRHVKGQHPAEGIIAATEELGADLIVVASHGRRGLSRVILGSQANAVVVQSKVPVLVCR
ncbi:MAG: universal stress protein [Pseudomonadota bacterium]